MKKSQISSLHISFSFLVSISGLVLIIFLVLQLNPETSQTLLQRSSVGVLYCILCLFGITAVFYPVKCRLVFDPLENREAKLGTLESSITVMGHHPSCQKFDNNRIKIGRLALCSACTGLLIGAIVALTGTVLYFFGDLKITLGNIWFMILGEILMLVGLTQIRFAGKVKAALNAAFVVGSFLILVEVDALLKNLFVDLYVFGLILFLLWFRISLSEWNNRRTCASCQLCFQLSSSP